ncbi:cupin domain-containing protein (plasmid) [Nissabacter sp. SGAir0207]|nr:cupin domain-containing protein [Nissabacter sp. SGAir0207]QCR38086.1 cupin domain-containing protein [Nissabacter sp. SGAir0207]
MKRISVIALSLMCCSFALSAEENGSAITVWKNGTQPSVKGSADYFTGSVRIDAPFKGTGAARVSGASVTFEPAARTAWHTHPQGQTLIVTAGVGRVQEWGKPVREIRPGDTVWIPAGVKHWHGAAPESSMTHIAIAENVGGKVVDWMEKVSDEQYGLAEKS